MANSELLCIGALQPLTFDFVHVANRVEAEALWGTGSELVETMFPRPRPVRPVVEPEPEHYGPADIYVLDRSNGAADTLFAVVTSEDTGRDSSYDQVQGLYRDLRRAKNEAGYLGGWVERMAVL